VFSDLRGAGLLFQAPKREASRRGIDLGPEREQR
jgi:hypothetical protein